MTLVEGQSGSEIQYCKLGWEGGKLSVFYHVTGSRNQVGMMAICMISRLPMWAANNTACLHGYLEIQGFPGVLLRGIPLHNVNQNWCTNEFITKHPVARDMGTPTQV